MRISDVGSALGPSVLDHSAGLPQTFVHDLVRATLYDAMPPLRRIEGHRRVAEALEQLHLEDLPAHVNELAHHFTVAAADGRAEPAIGYLALAGDAAREQRAPAEAVDHYQRALELLGPQADTRRRCDLLIALGKARSEEHTSELQSLMRISYAVFCLNKKKPHSTTNR